MGRIFYAWVGRHFALGIGLMVWGAVVVSKIVVSFWVGLTV